MELQVLAHTPMLEIIQNPKLQTPPLQLLTVLGGSRPCNKHSSSSTSQSSSGSSGANILHVTFLTWQKKGSHCTENWSDGGSYLYNLKVATSSYKLLLPKYLATASTKVPKLWTQQLCYHKMWDLLVHMPKAGIWPGMVCFCCILQYRLVPSRRCSSDTCRCPTQYQTCRLSCYPPSRMAWHLNTSHCGFSCQSYKSWNTASITRGNLN